jgi:flagellar FliJ protein
VSSRANRLEPAVEQAKHRSEDALAQLALQQQQLAKAETQLSELRRYRKEYAQAGDGSLTVSALLNRQNFVERIDQAVLQQAAEVARLGRLLEQMRGRWQQAHARESALDNVVAHYREEERQTADRHEQAEVDERMQYRRPR